MILTRDDRAKWKLGRIRFLVLLDVTGDFSCGLKQSSFTVILSKFKFTLTYRSELFITLFILSNLVESDINISPGKYFFYVCFHLYLSLPTFVLKEF